LQRLVDLRKAISQFLKIALLVKTDLLILRQVALHPAVELGMTELTLLIAMITER
jgi:hypothetical protein